MAVATVAEGAGSFDSATSSSGGRSPKTPMMQPFEVIYLGRSRFHLDRDATAMYFRVLRAGRYVGAYAGAVSGPDMVTLGARPTKAFWAALAHSTTGSIGVRLLNGVRTTADPHATETIWMKATDLKPHLADSSLHLPTEDQVFRTFTLEEDPLDHDETMSNARILSGGSTRLGLKAAAGAPIQEV